MLHARFRYYNFQSTHPHSDESSKFKKSFRYVGRKRNGTLAPDVKRAGKWAFPKEEVIYCITYSYRMMAEDIMNHPEIPDEIRSAPFFEVRIHFFVDGIMNTYQQWAEHKTKCTLTEISQKIASLIQKSAADLMDAPWLK